MSHPPVERVSELPHLVGHLIGGGTVEDLAHEG